jgi:MFS family permease
MSVSGSLFFSRQFLILLFYRGGITLAYQILSVAAGWHVYEMTHSVLVLGFVGLAEVIPYFCCVLFAGYAVDTFSKKRMALMSTLIHVALAGWILLLMWVDFSWFGSQPEWGIYIALGLAGVARSIIRPAYQAFFAQIVSRQHYPRATAVGSTVSQVLLVLGPAIGGLLIAWFGLWVAYASTLFFSLVSLLAACCLHEQVLVKKAQDTLSMFASIGQGFRFVLQKPILFSAMSLDMLAVLLGGATSLLPAFIHEVLNGSPEHLAILRSAPALGAVVVGIILAKKSLNHHTGHLLLLSVLGFGVSIVAFGLSKSLWWAAFWLMLSGTFDGVSMIIRQSIYQLVTPAHLQGRVSSINGVFIGSSNEIGAFESGLTASWFGLVPSIVLGGALTMVVVVYFYVRSPSLSRLNLKQLIETSSG